MTKKTNQTKTRRGQPSSETMMKTATVASGVVRWGQRNSFRTERWRRFVSAGREHPVYTNFVRVRCPRQRQSKLKFTSRK